MSFNGSGVFQRLYNFVNDANAKIKIRADRMDAEMNGMATGLSTCITKDGQTTVTANLPMAGYKHTGVGNASNRDDYAALGQAQDGKLAWADAGGTADAITAAYTIPITALVDGQLCYVRAGAANATTTPTFSPNGLTARTIVKQGGNALAAGDIAGDGHELILRYDLSNTRWELLNPVSFDILPENNTFTGNNIFQGIVDVTNINAETSSGGALRTSGGTNCITWGIGGSANSTLGGNMSGANTNKLVNMADPTSAQDYATKAYVDASSVVQEVYASNASVSTTTSAIPRDDTLPQSTEGVEVVTVAITPTDASNYLIVEANVHLSSSAGSQSMIVALFKNSDASALSVGANSPQASQLVSTVPVRYRMVAGGTSAITFKVRGGAASGTTTINGEGGSRVYGGGLISDIKVTEVKA